MKPFSIQHDESPEDLSLTVDTGPSSELAPSTLTLSADPTVPLVPGSTAAVNTQVNPPTGVTVSF